MTLKENIKRVWKFISENPYVKAKANEIIFGTDTYLGRLFDVILIWFILLSVGITIIETVDMPDNFRTGLHILEWIFTVFFTFEYILRLYCSENPKQYALSVFGIIDILSILPTYLAVFVPQAHAIMVIRIFRVMRIFRIFKLFAFIKEGEMMLNAIKLGMRKTIIFAVFVLLLVVSIGAVMFLIEGGEGTQFSSIPESIYWAVVTLTTVGYGDITPVTPLGRFLTMIVMLLGYAILSVPTGIFSLSLASEKRKISKTKVCLHCGSKGQETDAIYCRHCGALLIDENNKGGK